MGRVRGTRAERERDEVVGLVRETCEVRRCADPDDLEQRGVVIDEVTNALDHVGERRAISPLEHGDSEIPVEVLLGVPVAIRGPGGVPGAAGCGGELHVRHAGHQPALVHE